jgi:hypothetical protein
MEASYIESIECAAPIRCVGLGSGANTCVSVSRPSGPDFPPLHPRPGPEWLTNRSPPESLWPDARTLIKPLPRYNSVLAAHRHDTFDMLDGADQQAISHAVAASKKFGEKLAGAHVSPNHPRFVGDPALTL